MHTLLCDDHLLFLEVMGPALETRGHTVDVATSIDEAVARLRVRRPDVAVLDLGFPAGSGIDGIRRISTLAPAVKVVVLTGLTDPALTRQLSRRAPSASGTRGNRWRRPCRCSSACDAVTR
jgi:ActR/RegA family two-component response regulator